MLNNSRTSKTVTKSYHLLCWAAVIARLLQLTKCFSVFQHYAFVLQPFNCAPANSCSSSLPHGRPIKEQVGTVNGWRDKKPNRVAHTHIKRLFSCRWTSILDILSVTFKETLLCACITPCLLTKEISDSALVVRGSVSRPATMFS